MKSDSNDIKVSIITPVYNAEKYIINTIESVICQSYQRWEMILVDDCSTDRSKEIIRAYCEKDERIILVEKKSNSGQIDARNIAIKKATGAYIAFLDSDDLWHPDKLKLQIQFMKDNNCNISHTYYGFIDEEGDTLHKEIKAPLVIDYKKLLKANYLGCLTVMYNAAVLGKYDMPNVGKRDDWACWLNIAKDVDLIYCLPINLASYRVRKNSISSNKIRLLKYNWNVIRKSQRISIPRSIYYLSMQLLISVKKHYLT